MKRRKGKMSSSTVKRLAIIPARGGSKRIPRKNIKDFLGEPIIVRVLKEVAASELFSAIHVSTEDSEIATVAEMIGFPPPFLRSPELATDEIPLRDVLIDVVKKYQVMGQQFETIVLIFATAVLIDHKILQDAIRVFEEGNRDSQLLSIAAFPVPLNRALVLGEDNSLQPLQLDNSSNVAYFDTGDFVIYSEKIIFENTPQAKRKGYVIPRSLTVGSSLYFIAARNMKDL